MQLSIWRKTVTWFGKIPHLLILKSSRGHVLLSGQDPLLISFHLKYSITKFTLVFFCIINLHSKHLSITWVITEKRQFYYEPSLFEWFILGLSRIDNITFQFYLVQISQLLPERSRVRRLCRTLVECVDQLLQQADRLLQTSATRHILKNNDLDQSTDPRAVWSTNYSASLF